jgi:hypothetical protein
MSYSPAEAIPGRINDELKYLHQKVSKRSEEGKAVSLSTGSGGNDWLGLVGGLKILRQRTDLICGWGRGVGGQLKKSPPPSHSFLVITHTHAALLRKRDSRVIHPS